MNKVGTNREEKRAIHKIYQRDRTKMLCGMTSKWAYGL